VSGTNPATYAYTYTNSAGNPQTVNVQVNYSTYDVQTNFGCGYHQLSNPSVSLASSIAVPGEGTYTIGYELTGTGYGNDVTGRIAKITLPTGGYISYTYTGVNNGFLCNGGVPTLTRTVNDNNGNTNTWTYVNSGGTVTETDPAGTLTTANQTVYAFTGENQTSANYYQGPATGTPLKTVVTCYNGTAYPCSTWIQQPGVQITQTDVYTSLNGSATNQVETIFDAYGNVTQVKNYDYGPGALLSMTTTSYGQTPSGSSCTAYPSGTYIRNTPCYSVTTNSAGAAVAKTQITYSPTGHPTATSKWVSGSPGSWLASSANFNSNGTVKNSTDVNGTVSTPKYGECNNLLPTSVTVTGTGLPSAGLTNSTTWDCNGGVVTQTADPNGLVTGNVTTYAYNDPLWRMTSMTTPMGNVTNYSYSPTTFESAMDFGSTSTSDTVVTTDGIGRPIFSQTRQAQGSGTFDTTQTTYGWTSAVGAFSTVSVPYSGTYAQPAPTGTKTTTTQKDAIGRALSITDGAGGVTSYSYIKNDVLQSVGPTPQTFQKQFQYNGMGQLTSVCEINSLTSSGNCGTVQTNAETGYLTQYSYDPLGNLLGANEAGQTRSYTYDGLSRMTLEENPESGTKTYVYDSSATTCGLGATTYNGDLVTATDAAGNCVLYFHDGLHRLTDVGNNHQGTTNPCRRFRYDNTTGVFGIPPVVSFNNQLGHLTEALTDTCASGSDKMITDEWLNYDANGRQTDLYQESPNSGAYYHTSASHWANGSVDWLSGVPGLAAWQYVPDGEGRPYSATWGSIDFVTGVTYYPANPQTSVSYGNGDSDVYNVDAKTGRTSGFQFTVGATPVTLAGALNWNPNGTLGSMGITDGFNAADTQNCSYGYDAVARISSVGCTNSANVNIWGQDYTFDAFGNITKTVPSGDTGTSFVPDYSPSSNQYTINGCNMTYDANGNVTNDCNYSYTWDVYGNPVGGNGLIYDAMNRLVEISPAEQILYSPIGKLGLMNGQAVDDLWFPLPGGSSEELLGPYGANRHTLHSDWLGNVRLATTYSDRSLAYDVAYSPYGENYVPAGSSSADVYFTGQRQQIAGGLFDFPYREYSIVGRWISPDRAGQSAADPTNPQSWNRYAYIGNNPLSATDPLGLFCVWDNGSYDSNDDHDTGIKSKCDGSGGTWFNGSPSGWDRNAGDWSGHASGTFAAWAQGINPSVGDFGDPSGVPEASVFGMFSPVAANNGWQQGPDPVAVANSMRQYVKAQTSNCYNGFHQTTGGKVVQAFSAVALFPVASNSQNNQISLGAEILGKLSMVAGSNSAGGLFTAFLEGVTADVTTPAYILGTGADAGALMLCGAGAATSIVP
jgi:RHS repeat-associated protein